MTTSPNLKTSHISDTLAIMYKFFVYLSWHTLQSGGQVATLYHCVPLSLFSCALTSLHTLMSS